MICLRCDNEKFVAAPDAVIEQEFKGDTLQIQTPALACSSCGWITLDPDQADELRRRTADAYRKKHGLLTSGELKALRKLLHKSQTEFAHFVGVGEASVKRWETWLVQEKSSDQLIRLKCEKALRELLPQTPPDNAWITFEISFTTGPAFEAAIFGYTQSMFLNVILHPAINTRFQLSGEWFIWHIK